MGWFTGKDVLLKDEFLLVQFEMLFQHGTTILEFQYGISNVANYYHFGEFITNTNTYKYPFLDPWGPMVYLPTWIP